MNDHDLTDAQDFIFVEITVKDPSEFATVLDVEGHVAHQRHRVLKIESATGSQCAGSVAAAPA